MDCIKFRFWAVHSVSTAKSSSNVYQKLETIPNSKIQDANVCDYICRVTNESLITMLTLHQLQEPYPLSTLKEALIRDVLFFLFMAIFLMVFRPFGLEVYSYQESHLILGYAIVTFAGAAFNDFLGYTLLHNFFVEKFWTVLSQIGWGLWSLLWLGILNFLYGVWIDAFPWTIIGFLKVQSYVVLCSVVPITLVVLIRQNFLLKKNLEEAQKLSSLIHHSPEEKPESHIVLWAENQKDKIELLPQHILYVESIDNYVEIVWEEHDELKKKLLRSTLSKIEEVLEAYPYLFRCHRAYLVNCLRIQKIEGNSQGYRLTLPFIQEFIPVSRSKGKALHEALESF